MPRLRQAQALRKPEDIAAVPPDQEVTIDLSPENTPPVPDTEPAPDKGTVPDKTPAVRAEPPPREEEPDATAILRQQLEAAQNAEKAQRERADREATARAEAERRAAERDQQLRSQQVDTEQAQYDAIANGIAATQNEIETAKRDVQAAGETSDWAKLADAQARLGAASGRLVQLEDGKAALDQRREEAKHAPQPRQSDAAPTVEARIDALPGLTASEKDWLKQHPDAFTDQEKNAYLGAAFWEATKSKGLSRGTPEYFQYLEERLGYRKAAPPPPNDEDEIDDTPNPPQPARRNPTVSAPVSRDVPSGGSGQRQNNRITLTAEEREAARFSGVSEVDYARQKQRLAELKRQGHYQER